LGQGGILGQGQNLGQGQHLGQAQNLGQCRILGQGQLLGQGHVQGVWLHLALQMVNVCVCGCIWLRQLSLLTAPMVPLAD